MYISGYIHTTENKINKQITNTNEPVKTNSPSNYVQTKINNKNKKQGHRTHHSWVLAKKLTGMKHKLRKGVSTLCINPRQLKELRTST